LLHKDIYTIGQKLSKRDKLGIHKEIENVTLELFSLLIESAFTSIPAKLKPLEAARIRASLLQNITRTENELGILEERAYLRISENLVSISKDINGWITDTIRRSQTQKRS
jgi:hypothetical protein